jgi:cytochrome b561
MKYALSSRIIHWVMAALILALIFLGIYMANFLPKDAENRMMIYGLHKSFGVIALILILVRIINRILKPAPKLPETITKSEQILAHIAHIGLYFLMLLVPLSGYLMSNSFGYPVHLFSIEMPFLVTANQELGKIFHETHEIAGYCLFALVMLHVVGVIKHRFFDKAENDVLKRMI